MSANSSSYQHLPSGPTSGATSGSNNSHSSSRRAHRMGSHTPEIPELSWKECAGFSIVLLAIFIGLIAVGAVIGNKASGGNKAETFVGGIFGAAAFILGILMLQGHSRRQRTAVTILDPEAFTPAPASSGNSSSGIATVLSNAAPSKHRQLSGYSLNSTASTALLEPPA